MSVQKILIVEDDEWVSEQYSRVLQKAGYNVKISYNALDAIQSIDDYLPDAIILDMLLTGSTALALLHELQSYGDTGSIPIILCTNLADELQIETLKSYGVKHIIDKTKMKPNDIVLALRRIIS
jgi:CheY-like chemotaxis protein